MKLHDSNAKIDLFEGFFYSFHHSVLWFTKIQIVKEKKTYKNRPHSKRGPVKGPPNNLTRQAI